MDKDQRILLAEASLKGISIGDAFGESFFGGDESILQAYITKRTIPKTTWEFTDDTIMAISVFQQLKKNGAINQDELAEQFCKNHDLDENRGYGATARKILREIGEGHHWKEVSAAVFDGMGSMGNGAAMRVAPIGAYHFDNLQVVKEQARKSAEITHSNTEGICGAMAVAIGVALATGSRLNNIQYTPDEFLNLIVHELPDSDTTSKIRKSITVPYSYHIETVKTILGNGVKMTAQDTVPFALWCASYNLQNFEESLWKAVSILGDRDTICAIVGGITMMSTAEDKIPVDWVNSVEDFKRSIFIHN